MLIRFRVQNFLSVDGPVEFCMEASKESQHASRVAEVPKLSLRLLQCSALWGGNASGKSNFIRCLRFIRSLVVVGTRPDGPTGRIPFKLREGAASEPSRFSFDLLVDVAGEDRVFRYSFAVTSREVVEESLTELLRTSQRVFFTRRSTPLSHREHVFTLDWWDRRSVSEEEKVFVRVLAKGTRSNQLFLHEAMDRNLELLAPIYCWFRDQLNVISSSSAFFSFETIRDNREELRSYISTMLNRADTGIQFVASEPVPIESLGLGAKLREDLMSELKENGSGIMLRSEGQRFSLFLKDGELSASRVVTFRKSKEGRDVAFDTSEESDGTLRLFDLAPVFHDLKPLTSRKVYVIDEPDRGVHTQLTRALLQNYFDSRSADSRTQFIFTTHDALLLDQSLLRRDEIWFVERGAGGDTSIESLIEYKDIRSDKDIRKAYLQGRFTGAPKLRPLETKTFPAEEQYFESYRLPELFD